MNVYLCSNHYSQWPFSIFTFNVSFNQLAYMKKSPSGWITSDIILLKDLKIPQKCDLAFPMPLTAVEPLRDRRRVASLHFRDCTAVVLRRHGGDGGATAGHGGDGVLLRSLYGATAVMAVPRRPQCGLAQPALALRKFWTCSKFPPCHSKGQRCWLFSAVLRRSMTEPLWNHCGITATMAVPLRFMSYRHRIGTAPSVWRW